MLSGEVQGRLANPEECFTYQNPLAYTADWKGYYDESLKLRDEVRRDLPHEAGLIYGDSPYHLANVYSPKEADQAQGIPFVVFFHGGRWREGHPDFYDALARPWVEAGAVFGSFGYRLEPDFTITDSVNDAVRALAWARDNAPRYGADPERIVLAGHSAGAHLIEMVALTDWVEQAGGDETLLEAITAIVCLSGPSVLSDLIPDYPDAASLSPALRITRSPKHVIVAHGDPEPNKKGERPGTLTESSRTLARALKEFGVEPTVVELGDLDHVQTATAFSDPQSTLFKSVYEVLFPGEDGTS